MIMRDERDFIGYGANPPVIEWPYGARIAVSVVVNYEEGSEASLLDGDAEHESNNEVPSPVPAGQRDLFNESFFEYGSRVGVWRILNTLDKYNVPSTFFCCAVAMERNREVARAVVERGHEVCGHGYRWEEYHSKTREEEEEAIRKTVESLTETTGVRPVGWFTRYGAERQHTGVGGGRRGVHIRQRRLQRRFCRITRRLAGSRGRCCRTALRRTMPGSGGAA